jgi:hypothetical protein
LVWPYLLRLASPEPIDLPSGATPETLSLVA